MHLEGYGPKGYVPQLTAHGYDEFISDFNAFTAEPPNFEAYPTPFHQHLAYGFIGQTHISPKVLDAKGNIIRLERRPIEDLLAKEFMPPNPQFLNVIYQTLTDIRTYHYPNAADCYWHRGARECSYQELIKNPEPIEHSKGLSNGNNSSVSHLIESIWHDLKMTHKALFIDSGFKLCPDQKLQRDFGYTCVRAIYDNEKWYEERGYQYQDYYTYLDKANTALEQFKLALIAVKKNRDKEWGTWFQSGRVFGSTLPMKFLSAIDAVQATAFNKLLALTEIKLNSAWAHVVSDGERFDIHAFFPGLQAAVQKNPRFECLQLSSEEWRFYQGKIANSILYFQTHTKKSDYKEFDILLKFASHLLAHHRDEIKKKAFLKAMVLTTIVVALVLGVSALSMDGGLIAHAASHGMSVTVMIELIASTLHIGHGMTDFIHELKAIALPDNAMPLEGLRQNGFFTPKLGEAVTGDHLKLEALM